MTAWTPDETEWLRRMAEKEGLSAGVIAQRMGGKYSRNAIVGRCHRKGITLRAEVTLPGTRKKRPSPPSAKVRAAIKRFFPPTPKSVEPVRIEPPVPPPSLSVSLLALRDDQCHWPGDVSFCGQGMVAGGYCAYHDALAHGRLR